MSVMTPATSTPRALPTKPALAPVAPVAHVPHQKSVVGYESYVRSSHIQELPAYSAARHDARGVLDTASRTLATRQAEVGLPAASRALSDAEAGYQAAMHPGQAAAAAERGVNVGLRKQVGAIDKNIADQQAQIANAEASKARMGQNGGYKASDDLTTTIFKGLFDATATGLSNIPENARIDHATRRIRALIDQKVGLQTDISQHEANAARLDAQPGEPAVVEKALATRDGAKAQVDALNAQLAPEIGARDAAAAAYNRAKANQDNLVGVKDQLSTAPNLVGNKVFGLGTRAKLDVTQPGWRGKVHQVWNALGASVTGAKARD